MGANYLAALGQAMPAITGTWRDILAQNRESEKWEQEKMLQPLKMETQQAQTEMARGGVALQKEQIKKYQIEALRQEEELKRGEVPVDIMGKMKEIGILDDWQGKVANYAKSSGYDTIMKTKDAKPFIEDLFNPKNPLGQQLIGDHYSYFDDLYRQEKESYDKGRYPDVEGKTLTEDKLKPIRNRMNQYKQKADMWMSLKANISELSKKQAMGEELVSQLEDTKRQYPVKWNNLSDDEKIGLETVARTGDSTAYNKMWGEIIKPEKPDKAPPLPAPEIQEYNAWTREYPGKGFGKFLEFKSGLKAKEKKETVAERLNMSDVKSAHSMDVTNIKNQMMVDMTPDEQANVVNQPPENILALLLAGKIGKALSPEKKKYYIDKLKYTEEYYGNLTNKVLERKGVSSPRKSSEEKVFKDKKGREMVQDPNSSTGWRYK